jgi:SAM-dependent methyltransferase
MSEQSPRFDPWAYRETMQERWQNIDPAIYRETMREQWESTAEGWHRWIPVVRAWVGNATGLMLALAQVGTGVRVLDVAAGDGDQSLLAAERVGSTGFVLATDIAPRLVALAGEAARARCIENFDARVMDAENLTVDDGTFDVVICRLGLFFVPDLPRALSEMRRALKPGGRIGAMVFSTPDKNPFLSVPISIIRRYAQLGPPLPGQPGPFSLGAPGALATALALAGFSDVQAREVSAPLRMGSARECARFEREAFGALHQMLAALDEAARAEAWQEVERELGKYEGQKGFESPCEIIVVSAVKN